MGAISCSKQTMKHANPEVSTPLTLIPVAPEEVPYIMVGTPFNSLSQDKVQGFSDVPKAGCIVADEMGTIGGLTNGLETYSITSVSSQEDFFRQIDIGYKTKVAATVEAVNAKGSQEYKGMHSIRINKNYSYVLVSAKKLWQAKQIKKASVNQEIFTVLKKDPSKFFSICGDEFLSGFKLITEARGVLECRADSREEKAKIDATISSSVGAIDTAGAETSFNAVIDQTRKVAKNKCTLYVWQRGGKGSISDKPETFGSSVANYVADSSFDNAALKEVATTPYQTYVVTADFWDLVQGLDLSFKVPRSVIKLWQTEIDVLVGKMQAALDAIDNEKDSSKKIQMYSEAQKLVSQYKVVQDNITRCSNRPDLTSACRDSRSPGDPWPDDPIIED